MVVRRAYCSVSKAIRETTKSGKERVIPINGSLHETLVHARTQITGQLQESRLVIEGFPWGSITRLMQSLCKRAGVKVISIHGFRHSFASNLVMAGVPLYDVQALLGHSDFRVTQMYAHLSPDHLRGVTECLKISSSSVIKDNVVSLRGKSR
jgi:site-specific recombinase XerD